MSNRNADYNELKALIKDAKLLERQYLYYIWKFVSTACMVSLSIALLFLIDLWWLQLANAVFAAFVFVQVAFFIHDAGHNQIFKSNRLNGYVGLGINFLVGISRSWWNWQHGVHHSKPNQIDHDPQQFIPLVVFSQEQALRKSRFEQFFIRYQAFYFFPFMLFDAIGLRVASTRFFFNGKGLKDPLLEATLMVLHFVVFFGIIFYALDFWLAVAFICIQQALVGLYMGSIFAPNHKGMLVPGEEDELTFVERQVLTSRNVRGNPFYDFWYGGLNYQIEHHLFMNMPRNRLSDAKAIVEQFCREKDISYHTTGMLQSYREILEDFHYTSAPLRAKTQN